MYMTMVENQAMATMVRKQIYIEPAQDALLKRLSDETGLSEAELIRQTIDNHLQARRFSWRNPKAWEQERAFLRQLMQQAAVPGGRTWTRDDLHER